MPLDTTLESFVRELKIVLYEINDVLTHAESMNEGISFSRFILAANACRRALPKTSMYSNRLSQDHSSNMVLVEMQKYIIHHKISLEEAFLYFDVDSSGTLEFEEFRAVVKKLLGNISTADIETAFNEMDEDHNGILVFSEFSNQIRKYFSKTPKPVEKIEETIILDEGSIITKDIDEETKTKESLKNFIKKFLEICKDQDMIVLSEKVKEKYIDSVKSSRENNLSENISKLGLVFEKKKHKIYLVKLLKLLVPKYVDIDLIFDEIDIEENKRKKQFMEFQVTLCEAGVLKLALSLINKSSIELLVEESTQLLTSLLKFGNIKIQHQFLQMLKAKNNSELFSFIRNQLREARDMIVKNSYEIFIKDPASTIDKIFLRKEGNYNFKSGSSLNTPTKPYLAQYLLQLLQYCCENCYTPFQNYIRTQLKKKEEGGSVLKQISINMIEETAQFLINIKEVIGNLLYDQYAVDLVIQAFETLIDSCRGPCIENQLILGTKKKLFKLMNTIFVLYNSNKDYQTIFKSAVRFLTVLIEGIYNQNISKTMMEYIDFKLLARLSLEIFKNLMKKKFAVFQESIVGCKNKSKIVSIINKMRQTFKVSSGELELAE